MAKSGKPTPSAAQYGRVLKDLIEQSGLKQSAVADDAGMSTGTVSSLVNGGIASAAKVSQHMDTLCGVFDIKREELDRRALYEGEFGLASARFGMNLGDSLTLWCSIVGDGQRLLEKDDVQISFDEAAELVLPLSVEQLVARVLKEKAAGKHAFENNVGFTISDASWFPFSGSEERPGAKLILGKIPYAVVYALRNTEQGRRISGELLNNWEPVQEIDPVLGRRLGVCVCILTSDAKLVFGRRFSNVGVRPEELDTGAVEGLELSDAVEDENSNLGKIRIEKVMERAVYEELGITASKIDRIDILNFGYDLGWAQWNFVGLCKTKLTAKEVQTRHKSVAPQRVEYKETYVVEAVPDVVFPWLANEPRGIWSCGLASVFYAMVHLHGIDAVEDAVSGMTFKISHNLIWN